MACSYRLYVCVCSYIDINIRLNPHVAKVMFNKTDAKGDRVSSDLEFIVYNHDGESGFNAIGSVQSRCSYLLL